MASALHVSLLFDRVFISLCACVCVFSFLIRTFLYWMVWFSVSQISCICWTQVCLFPNPHLIILKLAEKMDSIETSPQHHFYIHQVLWAKNDTICENPFFIPLHTDRLSLIESHSLMSFLTPCLELAWNLICFQKEVAVQKKDAASKYPPWRSFINSTAGAREASEARSFSVLR